MKNDLTPIEALRLRKQELSIECKNKETLLKDRFIFVRDNWSSLAVNAIMSYSFSAVRSFLPLSVNEKTGKTNYMSSAFAIGQRVLPLVWTIVQPILMKKVTDKIKSAIFGSGKTKRKRKSNTQDDDQN